MDDLRDTVDRLLEDGEPGHSHRTRVVITTFVLAITAVGVMTAVLAATSDATAVREQTTQERMLVASQDAAVQAASRTSLMRTVLQAAAVDEARAVPGAITGQNPASTARWVGRADAFTKTAQSLGTAAEQSQADADVRREQSLVAGRRVAVARAQQNTDTTIGGILAISLFLLGLALAVKVRAVMVLFVTAALVIGALATARLARSTATVPHVDAAASAAFDAGVRAADRGDCATAVARLRPVVDEPLMPEAAARAGMCLDGLTLLSAARPDEVREALADNRIALAARPDDVGLRNQVAWDELRLGMTDQARADLAPALDDPDDGNYLYALGTLSEIDAADGRAAASVRDARRVVGLLAARSAGFRASFYASARDDDAYFRSGPGESSALTALYASYRSAEANGDAPPTSPGSGSGLLAPRLTASYHPLAGSSFQVGYVTVDVEGVATKDGTFSLRVYSVSPTQGFVFEPGLSAPTATSLSAWSEASAPVTRSVPVPADLPGTTLDLEAYWNGDLVASRLVNLG